MGVWTRGQGANQNAAANDGRAGSHGRRAYRSSEGLVIFWCDPSGRARIAAGGSYESVEPGSKANGVTGRGKRFRVRYRQTGRDNSLAAIRVAPIGADKVCRRSKARGDGEKQGRVQTSTPYDCSPKLPSR